MEVQALPDASSFLEATLELRAREPVLTNLIGSIAEGVLLGRRYDSQLWLVVRDDADVVGCAVRTGPFNAVVSPMPPAAAGALGRWLLANDPHVPGLTGPGEVVHAASRTAGRPVTVKMREWARQLTELQPPRADRVPPGQAQRAGRADLDLLLEWLVAFEVEAGLQRFANRAHTGEQVDAGRLWFWRVDDQPVALGGHAPIVTVPGGTVGRIGPVYTPAEHRRRGYGSALTRALTMQLLSRCDHVMLFADAANPESNSIYQAMGFEVVAEIVDVMFDPTG